MAKARIRAREIPPDLIVKGGEFEPNSAATLRSTQNVFELRGAREAAPQGEKEELKDHFISREGLTYAGQHLIVDFWDGERLDDKDFIEETFRKAVEAAKATLLHIHLHRFSGGGGVSGVAVLAESHISIHTWPERGFAAVDIFMCGDAQPMRAVEVMREAFRPRHTSVAEHKRGIV
jgi:S-adenosylmethionine decarboxylase